MGQPTGRTSHIEATRLLNPEVESLSPFIQSQSEKELRVLGRNITIGGRA